MLEKFQEEFHIEVERRKVREEAIVAQLQNHEFEVEGRFDVERVRWVLCCVLCCVMCCVLRAVLEGCVCVLYYDVLEYILLCCDVLGRGVLGFVCLFGVFCIHSHSHSQKIPSEPHTLTSSLLFPPCPHTHVRPHRNPFPDGA